MFELNNCQFCGGEISATFTEVNHECGTGFITATCKGDCGAVTSIYGYTVEEAVSLWNEGKSQADCKTCKHADKSHPCQWWCDKFGFGDICKPGNYCSEWEKLL